MGLLNDNYNARYPVNRKEYLLFLKRKHGIYWREYLSPEEARLIKEKIKNGEDITEEIYKENSGAYFRWKDDGLTHDEIVELILLRQYQSIQRIDTYAGITLITVILCIVLYMIYPLIGAK